MDLGLDLIKPTLNTQSIEIVRKNVQLPLKEPIIITPIDTNNNNEIDEKFTIDPFEAIFGVFMIVGLMLIAIIFLFYYEGKKKKMKVGVMPTKGKQSSQSDADRLSYLEGAYLMDYMDSERSDTPFVKD